MRDVPGLNAAHEVNVRAVLQQRESLLDQRVAFLFFCADIHNGDLRPLDAQYVFHVNGSHFGKLDQMGRPGVYICATVNQQGHALLRRDQGCQGRALHAFDPAYDDLSAYQDCPRAACGHKGVCTAVFYHVHANDNG